MLHEVRWTSLWRRKVMRTFTSFDKTFYKFLTLRSTSEMIFDVPQLGNYSTVSAYELTARLQKSDEFSDERASLRNCPE